MESYKSVSKYTNCFMASNQFLQNQIVVKVEKMLYELRENKVAIFSDFQHPSQQPVSNT